MTSPSTSTSRDSSAPSDRPLRVLMVKGAYEPHGGPESVISDYLDHMDYTRFRPHLALLARADAASVPALIKDPEIVPQRQILWQGTFGAWQAARGLSALVDEWKIDVIHTHDHRSILAARLLMLQSPLPWISHMHGWLGKTGVLGNQINEGIAKRLQGRADIVIGGSRHTCSEVEHLGMRKLYVLPLGIAIPDVGAEADEAAMIRSRLGVASGAILCGVTARLHPGKGHRFLFEACRMLRDAGYDLQVLVVGEGDHRPALQQTARDLGLTRAIHFAGRVPRVLPYLVALDVFVLPSLKESLSLAVLEAMAAARPVVTTRVGDFHTLIEPGVNGMLVSVGDARALADGIAPLLSDTDLRARMASAGQRTVRERFSVDAMVRTMEGHYLEAVTANRFRWPSMSTSGSGRANAGGADR